MPVIPGRAQTPRSVHFGRGDLEGYRATGPGPTLFPAIPQTATFGARAAEPQRNKVEFGDKIVGEGDRYPLGALHMNIQRFKAIIHALSLGRSVKSRAPAMKSTSIGGFYRFKNRWIRALVELS